MSLEAIRYRDHTLEIIDQLLLPDEIRYVPVRSVDDAWTAIRNMQVRGAPAIAIVGCLGLGVELWWRDFADKDVLWQRVDQALSTLVSARPTAVNMAAAASSLRYLASQLRTDKDVDLDEMKLRIVSWIEGMLEADLATNRAIGDHGARSIQERCRDASSAQGAAGGQGVTLLTHCNTGALATAGYGTALGVVRSLRAAGALAHVWCTETRPYNQGARLTALELVHEGMPATLLCDSSVAALLRRGGVDAVVVGADRVAANGDTANKIGTYQVALAAKEHGVPFYVAAPFSSVDLSLESGESVVVEERPAEEITHFRGQRVAAPGISCWNPAFDVTPASLITGGIITEKGVFRPDQLRDAGLKKDEDKKDGGEGHD